ncbi:rRNA methyltransferase 3A, mitochondrial isoform X2 [Latimeria chalumnae]|uniref:rRNA methyltransferase 3A, mitochondrial isoform X2 n=1 Tax=Latimeria chalumnae TaxID=7897 RepID=UPI00313B580C
MWSRAAVTLFQHCGQPEGLPLGEAKTSQSDQTIFARPDHSKMKFPTVQMENTLPLSLICDNIRDPGNLGTILRSATGAGCDKVLLTKGCVDVWEPKVLRAGMGAHFRIPVIPSLEWNAIPNYLPSNTRVFVADSGSKLVNAEENKSLPGKARDYGWVSSQQNQKQNNYEEYDSSDEEEYDSEEDDPVKIIFPEVNAQYYYDSWAQGRAAVVIGGETHGLSLEAFQLAERAAGKRLLIPMVPGVESLNSAMAASILLFEGRKQLGDSRAKENLPKVWKKIRGQLR